LRERIDLVILPPLAEEELRGLGEGENTRPSGVYPSPRKPMALLAQAQGFLSSPARGEEKN
jgi:hypothetical protein